MKGLRVNIYRNPVGDCTNGAPSANATEAIVIGPDIPDIFEAKPETLVYRLARGNLPGIANLVQVQPDPGAGRWSMFGGNYAGTSDSRFGEAVEKIAPGWKHVRLIPIHDRYE